MVDKGEDFQFSNDIFALSMFENRRFKSLKKNLRSGLNFILCFVRIESVKTLGGVS